jgi:SAM-dependent methyltransferase
MLYHVPDRERALSEIHRVLRPGAHVYAATNGLNHLRELRDLVDKFRAQAETTNAAAEFGLENGAGQLSRHFAHITVHRQENALAVTEAEPLIGYARSMMPQSAWRQNGEALGQAVRKEIAAAGVIHIQKDAGLFEAVRA